MGKHTPTLKASQLEAYLNDHLVYELRWLLRAANEWHVQNFLGLGIEGYEVQVFAMDSSFLHARTLFEFLTGRTTNNYYGCDAFGISRLNSTLYAGDWKEHLHAALMHAQDRSTKGLLGSFDGSSTKALHDMPVDFAKEVVRLWRDFTAELAHHSDPAIARLSTIAANGLTTAIIEASKVANSDMAKAHGRTIPMISW